MASHVQISLVRRHASWLSRDGGIRCMRVDMCVRRMTSAVTNSRSGIVVESGSIFIDLQYPTFR